MKSIRICVTALFVLAVAVTSSAALSKQYADFPKGPADLLMTREERKQWKSIKTDEEAKTFIDLFWARRDPTPGTPANEFRDGYHERVEVAEDKFHSNYSTGSKSDRGKVFILMGSPTKIRRSGNPGASTIQTPTGRATMGAPTPVQAYSPKEVWEYEQSKSPIALGQPLVRVVFIDQYATNDWKMERTVDTDYNTVFESIAVTYVAQPDLREVPTFEVADAPAPVPTAPTPATGLKNDALRDAIEKSGGAESKNLFVTYGEFITPKGEHFVPVQLFVPGSTTDTQVTFFGVVEKAEGGEKVAAFEEPVTLTVSKDGSFYARSLTLPPGQYRGSFGLAKDGKPIGVVSTPIAVTGLDKDSTGVSSLMLSNNIYPLSEAQLPTDPFAFGGLKVVPKSDATFKRTDELWYFFEGRNLGLDPANNQPRLSVKLSLTGTTTDGKPVKMNAPAEITPGQELKGVPGHRAVGQAMPLSTFKPGSYKLAVKVTDLVSNQTWDLEGAFRIVE